jgi:hypothetical protein
MEIQVAFPPSAQQKGDSENSNKDNAGHDGDERVARSSSSSSSSSSPSTGETPEGALEASLSGLRQFKTWLDGYSFAETVKDAGKKKEKKKEKKKDKKKKGGQREDDDDNDHEEEEETAEQRHARILDDFKSRHSTQRAAWVVPASFPEPSVADAYLHPRANMDTKQFQWSVPLIHRVRGYVSLCYTVVLPFFSRF